MPLFGIEYLATARSKKWRRCSMTMHCSEAIAKNAADLQKQEGWFAWRVVKAD